MMPSILALRNVILPVVLFASHSAFASQLSLQEFAALAAKCSPNVASSTLASVAMTESSLEPLTIHDNTTGASAVLPTLEKATATVNALMAAGHSVDVGLMQINSANFSRLGMTASAAFDPCVSITAAGRVLADAYTGGATNEEQQAALRGALSAYNTGNTKAGLRNGYVRKVEIAATRMVPALDVGIAPHPTVAKPGPAAAPPSADEPTSWDVWAATGDQKPAEQQLSSSSVVF